MTVVVARNRDIASIHAFSIVRKQLDDKPSSVFLLPTGSTPLRLYGLLAESVKLGKASFSKAVTFNLDEYLGIGSEHPQSYNRFMWDNFLGKIDIKKENVFIPESRPANAEEFCRDYENEIKKSGIDLAILGLGDNGHIGFNEPGTLFFSETNVATLTPSTIKANSRFFGSEKEVPRQAITAGLKTIMRAKAIIVMAFGKGKARIVRQAIEGGVTETVPASVLQKHGNVLFILDKEAASMLENTELEPPTVGKVKIYSENTLPRGKSILFFSPHPDDTAISAGALISSLSAKNRVIEVVMTSGHRATSTGSREQRIRRREMETLNEAKVLGTEALFMRSSFYDRGGSVNEADLEKTREIIRRFSPDIIFVPQKYDPHPRHSISRKTVLAAAPKGTEIWDYETPWGLFGHNEFNACFEFSKKEMRTKLKSIRKHASQLGRTRFDMAAKNIAETRRIIIPELIMEYGKHTVETKPYLELYNITRSRHGPG